MTPKDQVIKIMDEMVYQKKIRQGGKYVSKQLVRSLQL